MTEKMFLSLQESEAAVLQAASRFFAAYLITGAVTDQNRETYLQKSVKDALDIALKIDQKLVSDDELDSGQKRTMKTGERLQEKPLVIQPKQI